jgi:peptidoglycan hydrolase-like protein with peptidoglycan-binding domain
VSNGGSVAEKSYSQSYTRIHGYGNPAYSEISTGGPKTVTVELSVLQTGDKGAQVRALQILLNGRGYSPGKPDGDFGPKTKKAVTAYQKAKGLSADGVVGAQTWTALLRS